MTYSQLLCIFIEVKNMENNKPLSKYYRQAQISIKLPSMGKFYDDNTVSATVTGEHPVMPMTAMDELAFKTPDSLMNGQATVDVIKSCIPTIKNPWGLVQQDIDTVLIGIRIASYGENMDVEHVVPSTSETTTHSVNLVQLLESLQVQDYKMDFTTKQGLNITVSPLTYKTMTDAQLKTFEQQKIASQVDQSELPSDDKAKRFNDSFKILNELNRSLVIANIHSITLPDGNMVTDKAQIDEFLQNADTNTVKEIENKLLEIRAQGSIKPIKVNSTEEQIKNGAPVTYEVPISIDSSNFFV